MANFKPHNLKIKNGDTVSLRSLTPSDAGEFRQYLLKISEESTFTYQYPGIEYPTVEKYSETLEKILLHPFNLHLGVFVRDSLIAVANVRKEQDSHPWVPHVAAFGMTVLKEHWGHGVGRVLLGEIINHCGNNKILRLEARVRTNNPRAIALYKKAGFVIEGTRSRCVLIHNEFVDEYFIAKFFD